MITQNRKILIVYASQFGSTGGIADAIKNELSNENTIVDTKPIKDVTDLVGYDAVIIGSPIQFDKWTPKAREFVRIHRDTLKQIPVAYFFTCMVLSLQTEKSKRQGQVYSEHLFNAFTDVKPLAIGKFSGALDLTRMSIFLRLAFQFIMALTGAKEGDHRDWNAIRAWSKGIDQRLSFVRES